MRVGLQLYWFLVGFAVAAIFAAALQAEPAAAQTRPQAKQLPPATKAPALRGSQAPARDNDEFLPDSGDIAEDGEAAAQVEALANEESDAGDGATSAPAGFRASVTDGDMGYSGETAPAQDGLVQNADAEPPPDGADPTRVDLRPAEDIAAFESPPAGHDPLLFQIEDIDPIEDRRISRFYRFEPYDPKGIRVGSFVLFPETDLAMVAVRNVLRSPHPKADIAVEGRPSIRLVSNWRMHALEFRASGVLNAHEEFASEDERAYHLETRGRFDISKRSNVQVEVLRDVTQESRQVLESSRLGTRSDVRLDSVQASFNQRFNRLSLQLRGGVSDIEYSSVQVGGVRQSNADRNYTRANEAMRVSWEFKPTLTAFAEAGIDRRDYDTVAFSDGILRNSFGERYRFGVSFGNLGAYLRGEASAGWGRQSPSDSRLKDITGIIVDANIAWKVTGLTTVSFKASSDFLESNIAGTAGNIARMGGAEVRHAFRPWLIATAGLTYTATDYAGISLKARELNETAGLEYYLNHEWTLYGRYKHTDYTTTALNSDYSDDEFKVGVRWRR